jgi:hypothetical protein
VGSPETAHKIIRVSHPLPDSIVPTEERIKRAIEFTRRHAEQEHLILDENDDTYVIARAMESVDIGPNYSYTEGVLAESFPESATEFKWGIGMSTGGDNGMS